MKVYTINNNKLVFRLLCIILLFSVNLITAQTIDEIVNKTTTTYQNLKSFYLEFTQKFCEKTSGVCQIFEGCIYFLKPNYFRMEIKNPKQIYVGDSVSLWLYLPERKKAIRQHFGHQIPFAINPDLFLNNYNDRFNAELKINKLYEIVLTPKEETEIFEKVIIQIDKTKYEIAGITIIDETESTNEFIFKNIQLNKNLSKKLFKFNPPKGTEIIEQ